MSKLKPVFDIAVSQYNSGAILSDELTSYFCAVVNTMSAFNIPIDKYAKLLNAYMGIDSALDEQINEFLPKSQADNHTDFTYYDVSNHKSQELTETITLNATNRKLFERYKDSVQVVDGEHVLYLIPRLTSWRGYDGVPDAVEDWGGWIWDNNVVSDLGLPDKVFKNTVYRVLREG